MIVYIFLIAYQAAIALIPRQMSSLFRTSLLRQVDLLRLFLRIFACLRAFLLECMSDAPFSGVMRRVLPWTLSPRTKALLQLLTVSIEILLLRLILLLKWPSH